MEKLINLYRQWAGEEPAEVIKLAGQGSNRQYFRIIKQDGDTVIGVVGTSRDEDHAFIYLANHFNLRQLPVPKILAVSEDQLCYIQTDLGGTSLFDAIKGGREAGGRYNQKEKELLKKTIRELPNIQLRGARGLDWSNCYPQPEFDVDSVLFDLNYFKYCFLKPTDLDFHELKLEANFRLFAKDLTSERWIVSSIVISRHATLCWTKMAIRILSISKVAERDRSIMIWLPSSGRLLPNIPSSSAGSWFGSIISRSRIIRRFLRSAIS